MKNTSTSVKKLHHTLPALLVSTLLLLSGLAVPCYAQLGIWIADDGGGAGTGTGDFFDPSNWDNGVVPIGNNKAPVIRDGGTAIITAAGTGAYPGVDTEALILGDAPNTSGTIQIDSGSMTLYDAASTVLGNNVGGEGTLIMNGGYLEFGDVHEDGPGGGGAGTLVFANAVGTTARLEMHNDAVMRSRGGWAMASGSEADVPVGTTGLPSITVAMDGTSEISVAGGITLRGGNLNMALSDDSELTLGNSHGPGDASGFFGVQNGHFNVGARYGATADIVVDGNAVFNLDALYNEKSQLTLTVRDNGEFNIFNTATGGTETDFGMQSYLSRESNSTNGMSSSIVTLEGSGKFTVDSQAQTFSVPGNKDHPFPNGHADLIPTDGLILAGGDLYTMTQCGQQCNGRYNGGVAVVDVTESAEFSIEQTLWMTMANNSNASSTLKITGPDATVSFGDLVMAEVIDQEVIGGAAGIVEFGDPLWLTRNGKAQLHNVITGPSHTTIQVTDGARIGNGELVIELDGYNPVSGDSYTLLQTGDPNGREGEFKAVDLALAPLRDGLSWDLVYNADSVVLNVIGEASPLLGDFSDDGIVNIADYTAWRDNLNSLTALPNDNGLSTPIGADHYDLWKTNFGEAFGALQAGAAVAKAGEAVPEPLSAGLLLVAAAMAGIPALRR